MLMLSSLWYANSSGHEYHQFDGNALSISFTNLFCLLSQIDLLDPKGRKVISSCFDPTGGGKDSFGWCATCDPNAKRGQRGYCGPGETTREEEAPILYPNSTNWGFCSTECRGRYEDGNKLQARVHLRYLKL